MNNSELYKMINDSPVTTSLLYDLGLLPEQIEEGTANWIKMASVVLHIEKAKAIGGRDALTAKETA